MDVKKNKTVPEIKGLLRSHVVEVPSCIRDCSGIKIFGKRIKSLLFTTDVAIIRNTNADAIIAVYPFTPQPLITQGKRVVNLALDAEFKGAMGVVVNSPTSNLVVSKIRETIDIPIIVTVVSIHENIKERIESGATILNVSGGKNTPEIVARIRAEFPDFPIIATGGPNEDSIRKTIDAGANAITYTPPSNGDTMSGLMNKYRNF